jgi:uncharacterized protein YkwD
MYRVALAFLVLGAVAFGGCSLNSSAISSGYAESDGPTTASFNPQSSSGFGFGMFGGDEPAPLKTKPQKVAALSDQAPSGSFEKATRGALSDRDYSRTALDPQQARDLINKYRREKGLKPLVLNAQLSEAAKAHSRDLAKWDRISHYGSDGSNPWDRVKRVGYPAKVAAENVGTGQVNFVEVLKGWKESPGHNKNLLLTDGTEMGLALVQDPKSEFKSFWTLVVAAPM